MLMKLTACQTIILFRLERRGRRFHQTLLVKQKKMPSHFVFQKFAVQFHQHSGTDAIKKFTASLGIPSLGA